MAINVRKQSFWLIFLVILIAISATMSHLIERDFGKVDVTKINIMTANGDIVVAKLFRPYIATPDNPVPAIVNMHGYQNDKNVQDPFSIELAKRGFVVLAPDSLGHGDSRGGLDVMSWFVDPAYVIGNEDALA